MIYDNAVLIDYAGQIKHFLKEGKDVYSYFSNSIGNSFENARTLQALVNTDNCEL